MTVRVLVVGAGIMGAATAFNLARSGQSVLLVERAEPAAGATGASFARLSAFDKTPENYYRLNQLGIAEHAQLAAELGDPNWYHPCGSVIWEPGDSLTDRAARFTTWGEQLRLLDPHEARNVVGPHVRFPQTVEQVVHAPLEGWVDPVACTRALAGRAGELGAELVYGQTVTRLDPVATGRWRAVLSSGHAEDFDAVVNATGIAVGDLAPSPQSRPRLLSSRGLLGEIDCPDRTLDVILHSDEVSVRPTGGHRILCRSDQVDRILAAHGLAGARTELLRRVRDVLPYVDATAVVRTRIGDRVMPHDRLPKVGAVTGHPGYYQIVSHSGIILGPLIGRLLATQIATGQPSDLLAQYMPQ